MLVPEKILEVQLRKSPAEAGPNQKMQSG